MNTGELLSPDLHRIPFWVCSTLNVSEKSIAHLHVGKINATYHTLLEYLAHRAVDIDEDDSTIPTGPMCNKELVPMKSRKLAKTRRECAGLLSTLSIADKGTFVKNMGAESDNEEEPLAPVYTFGFGRAKLTLQEELVCVNHLPPNKLRTSSLYFYAPSPQILRSLIDSIFQWKYERDQPDRNPKDGKYELYTIVLGYRDATWKRVGWKKSRALETIFLPLGEMDAILSDFKSFVADGTKEWYVKHGLPNRRSYLFYGPPGTGKTSTIRALAGELNLAACFIELGDNDVSNTHLSGALSNLPLPAMLVIEDVDAIFNENRKTKNKLSPLTFSGLLNALDGLISTDGVLTVMTTNHPDRLDPALVRAGRIDRKFEFKKPKNKQFVDMFKSFYPDASQELAQEFGDLIVNRKEKESSSIATLMELFIYARQSTARECVDKVDEFFKEFYPKSGHDHLDWLYS